MKKFALVLMLGLLPLIQYAQSSERAFLGIHSNHVSEEKAEKLGFDNAYGSYVTSVIDNTAAERIGLQAFDYVYGIDDEQTNDDQSLTHILRERKPGDLVTVKYIRKGEPKAALVELGRRGDSQQARKSREERAFFGVRQSHDKPRDMDGVAVNIVNNSSAKAMGMENGDVIQSINDYPIYDWHDLSAAIDELAPEDEIKVAYVRDGQQEEGVQNIKSYASTYPSNGSSHNLSWNWGGSSHEEEAKEDKAEEARQPQLAEADIEAEEARLEAEAMAVVFEDVTQEEADDMKDKKGIDMPIINNLAIEQLTIFPNPSMGRFRVRFELLEQGPTQVSLFSGNGQLLYQRNLGNFVGAFDELVDITGQPGGFYFLNIQQNNKSLSKKVIVQ
ncbi:MAG: PDZ domain-containing protein [Bacteroidota bacterium]